MLCCAIIALLLSPLGLVAARMRASGAECCPKQISVWPFAAGGTLALAACAWLALLPPGNPASFRHICTIAGLKIANTAPAFDRPQ
jgi:hypothetical protein